MFAVHRLRTYAVFDFVILLRAKPRPSKKARLDKAAEEDTVLEPGKTPDLDAAIPEDIPNDPPQRDDNHIVEEGPIDTSSPVNQPTSSTGLRNPPLQQSLLTSQQPQCKPAVPRMMRLSLLALAILSQAILSLYPNILPRKNLLPLAKASGMLIWRLTLL